MNEITAISSFVVEHWEVVVAFLLALQALVSAYVRNTETKEDDIWLRKWLDRLSFFSALGERGTLKPPFIRNSRNDR